jgi:NitT/TauT family transport system substrate-binding protein
MVIFAVLSLVTPLAPVQANQTTETPLITVRMAELGVTNPVQDLAVEKGIFARHGIDLQVVHFIKGGAEATAGVASGQVDMGSYGTPILTGISFGLPIKIVGSPPVKSIQFELVGRPEIKSIKDLKGKVVASGALGGGSHQSILKILHGNGLAEGDVQIVANGGTDAEMILRSGKVDAVISGGIKRIKMEDEGTGVLLAKSVDYYGRYQHSFVFATNDFIKTHPEAVRHYLQATRESLVYAQAHLDELIDFTAKQMPTVKPSILRRYYLEQFKLWDPTLAVDIEGTANAVKILKELKELKPSVQFDEKTWLDLRFLPTAGTSGAT